MIICLGTTSLQHFALFHFKAIALACGVCQGNRFEIKPRLQEVITFICSSFVSMGETCLALTNLYCIL